MRRVRARCQSFLTERLEERIGVQDAELRRRVCGRLAAFGMVLLDGFFVAHQVDQSDASAVSERFAIAMELARNAILIQEGVLPAGGGVR